MKTTKILIAATLVLLTMNTFAQATEGLFVTVIYAQEINRVETWVSESQENENESSLEQWMSSPFEESILEEPLHIESWMLEPFETNETEDELCLEEWMSNPFKTDELFPMEKTMAASNW